MKMLKVHYTINKKLNKQTYLNTISAETNKLVFKIGEHEGEDPIILRKSQQQPIYLYQKVWLRTMKEDSLMDQNRILSDRVYGVQKDK